MSGYFSVSHGNWLPDDDEADEVLCASCGRRYVDRDESLRDDEHVCDRCDKEDDDGTDLDYR